MKKKLIIIFLTLTAIISPALSQTVENNFSSLKGEMISEYISVGNCGFEEVAEVIEFNIIELSDSKYKSKTIAVIIHCPDDNYPEDFFQRGRIYEMHIASINIKSHGYLIGNQELLAKNKLTEEFWAISPLKIFEK